MQRITKCRTAARQFPTRPPPASLAAGASAGQPLGARGVPHDLRHGRRGVRRIWVYRGRRRRRGWGQVWRVRSWPCSVLWKAEGEE
jgi:hypothetical protein